jgi:hypothetical protein
VFLPWDWSCIVTLFSFILKISDDDTSTETHQEEESAQDSSGWLMAPWTFSIKFPYNTQIIFGSLLFVVGEGGNLELLIQGPAPKTSCAGVWNNSILSGRSIYIRRGLLMFESSCRVVLSLCHDNTSTPDWENHLPVFGWNIAPLVFGGNSWSGFHRRLPWDRGQLLLEPCHHGSSHQHGGCNIAPLSNDD